jgi:hypothetical protein
LTPCLDDDGLGAEKGTYRNQKLRLEWKMTKWEYLFISPANHRNEWKPCVVNGRELRDWKSQPNLYDYFVRLGDQGWELVAVSAASYMGKEYCFKRQKT